jgi:fructose-bisphosphate aldolase, class II
VDALAVAIGTSHGAYKFTRKPTGDVLAIKRIIEIHEKLPHCHLVMHGSSSVPKHLIDIINQYGGRIRETYGVPIEEIQKGIQAGVRKINVDTDNRLAMTGAVRQCLSEKLAEFDLRAWMSVARSAMQKVCEERMQQFGQAGHAPLVPIITLEQMAKDYIAGKYGESAKPRKITGERLNQKQTSVAAS